LSRLWFLGLDRLGVHWAWTGWTADIGAGLHRALRLGGFYDRVDGVVLGAEVVGVTA
jgi:hypothetical protein